MTETASQTILSAIRREGPITFAEFMHLALYGPGGFYEQPPIGSSGHFVTSPHVHEVFGELLGRGIRSLWGLLDRPDPFTVVELGAGDGTLARLLLSCLDDLPVRYVAVETSGEARGRLATVKGVSIVAAEMVGVAHVIIAHELLDNLPFRVLRGDHEVRVGLNGDRLIEVLHPADDELRALAATAPEGTGGDAVVPVGVTRLVDRISKALRPGFAVVIDYGGIGSTGGSLHGYRDHRLVEDVLAAPGTTDITVGVDFALVARRAEENGLLTFGPVRQAAALRALGFERWAENQLDEQRRALGGGKGVDGVRSWAGRSRASLLVDPSALGRHWWLVLSSAGLPQPDWLRTATEART